MEHFRLTEEVPDMLTVKDIDRYLHKFRDEFFGVISGQPDNITPLAEISHYWCAMRIFGSANLVIRGIKTTCEDIDIFLPDYTVDQLVKRYPSSLSLKEGRFIDMRSHGFPIEIYPVKTDVSNIDYNVLYEYIQIPGTNRDVVCVALDYQKRLYESMARKKDLEKVAMIDEWLSKNKS